MSDWVNLFAERMPKVKKYGEIEKIYQGDDNS